MKIAFVEPHLMLYGGIRRIMELSNRLVDLGEAVTLYHPTGGPCEWMEGRAATRPLETLRDEPHDVVIFNEPIQYRVVEQARARLKVFYILCLADRGRVKSFNLKLFWPRKGRDMALKWALGLPFLRLANATWMHRYLADEMGLSSELLLGGVNKEVFHPVAIDRAPGGFRILWSGDRRPRKGGKTVEKALRIVRSRHPEVVVDTYDGRNVPQSGMAAVYSAADLFVDAQHYAGWNNPVAEAMACGTPVVCTAIGGVEDFAFDGKTALLVPVGDAEALAAAIERMMGDSGLRETLKDNAYNHIRRFDWDRSAERLRDILAANLTAVDPSERS